MSNNKVKVSISLSSEDGVIPRYARPGDAGMDVCACEDAILEPGCTVAVPTGIKLAVPPGYEMQVRPRSGISLNTPLRISNSPGTIDSGFRDEVRIIMTNTSLPGKEKSPEVYGIKEKGNKNGTYRIKKGDRIAQFVLQKVPEIEWDICDSVEEIGYDRRGGFGSTGHD